MIQLKLQYDTFEEGEFTNEQNVSLESLLGIFEKNTEIIKSKWSYTITKPYIKFFIQIGQNYLRIQHFAKDAFTVHYCNDPDEKLYQANFYKKTVLNIITLFCQEKYEDLNKLIPRTSDNEAVLIKLFIKKDFIYHYKHRGLFFLVFNSVFNLVFFAGFLIAAIGVRETMFFFFPLLMALLFLSLTISLFVLENNYIKNSRNKTIQISSGSQKIVITNNEQRNEFNKSDISEVVFYANGSRSGFNEYSFSKIKFKDGRHFNISFMLIDIWILEYKLNGVKTRRENKFYPIMK
jgi:hypothetical protein